jgi:N6-adenosine-specific RNA methylase IME4
MLPFHPLANIFPLIEGDEFDRLVVSIKISGQRDAIIVHEGMVLDGRNRQRACEAAGIAPRYESFTGDNPLAYVIDKNLRRRHLDESQRADAAARLANLSHGGDRKRRDDQAANLPLDPDAPEPSLLPDVSQADAARLMNVSERLVRSAKAVQERGAPELQEAVRRGILPVSVAVDAAKLEPERQREVVRKASNGDASGAKGEIKKAARDIKEKVLAAIQLAAPEPVFGCILEDYEWDFEVYSRDTGMDRHAGNHYPVSADAHTAAEIVKRTEERMRCAAPVSVIGSWCTVPHLHIALEVMRLRGFSYKSSFVWMKDKAGTGYWNRNKHEIFLVGTRGSIPAPAMGTQFESVIIAPRGEHSVKPDWQYEFFERHFPHLPKIELNARRARPGWHAWGLEAPAATPTAPLSDDRTNASVNAQPSPESKTESQSPSMPEDDGLDIPTFLRRPLEAQP